MSYVRKNLVKKNDTSTIVYPNIISDNIPSDAITNDKIADDSVTISKLASHLYQHSYNIRWQKVINGITYSCSFSVTFMSQQSTAYNSTNIIQYLNTTFGSAVSVGMVRYYSLNGNDLEYPFVDTSDSTLKIEDTNGDEYDMEVSEITIGTTKVTQLY